MLQCKPLNTQIPHRHLGIEQQGCGGPGHQSFFGSLCGLEVVLYTSTFKSDFPFPCLFSWLTKSKDSHTFSHHLVHIQKECNFCNPSSFFQRSWQRHILVRIHRGWGLSPVGVCLMSVCEALRSIPSIGAGIKGK